MENISDLEKNRFTDSCFLSIDEAIVYLKKISEVLIDKSKLIFFVNKHLLPLYEYNSEQYYLKSDIDFIVPIIESFHNIGSKEIPLYELFYDKNTFFLSDGSLNEFDFNLQDIKENKAFLPALRNLITASKDKDQTLYSLDPFSTTYFSHSRITTKSDKVKNIISRQVSQIKLLERENSSHFANSAYYMGSKKTLSSFLVEAIAGEIESDGIVVDLMCGSGAASGAFSNFWETFSSDALDFSCILAKIQGGGFSVFRAKELIEIIIESAKGHAFDLIKNIRNYIEIEEDIFHSNTNLDLLERYNSFISDFPLYPNQSNSSNWNPSYEILVRKENIRKYPFCLFTSYFSNVYFGLRQCLEIDSLRYSIDNILDENEREWALGVLIATISSLASNYGGHFAQPIKLEMSNLSKIIEIRSQSIFHEFSIRFMNLASESEKKKYPIKTVKGPYVKTMSFLEDTLPDNRGILIYVDAPYKRDEYSRYYHLLETLVNYNYPSCLGNGRVPDKKKGERFKSEFFTRNQRTINNLFINLFTKILSNNWSCAWSYSDNGDANIKFVLESVSKAMNCEIHSYSIPYKHKSQGKQKDKDVVEYLIILSPHKN
ncbi:MAG: hypothetical protein K0M50_16285 [Prolixibacteraceae bacterium]|nr:hypothetical protein [Prolixibacteraceae bacterium]